MRRIFGAPKKKEPPPTLEQAGANLDARGTRIDEQIKKLDQQLMQFREQIKKTRPGPAQEALKRRALTVSSCLAHPCRGPAAVYLADIPASDPLFLALCACAVVVSSHKML
jgi:hypothetical protein